MLRIARLRELTQDAGRAAQVLPRQPRQRRHLVHRHPAVGAAPPDLGRRQRGPVPGVFERDHAQTCGTARSRARV
ncbi:DNA-directed RNA polymerase I subunit RPA34 [Lentzea californiensis]|uniref:DNA-directed RNA polymerase I subunit RPA34 n=1 Tax=Lentzea californiensis TaxID=438851 RepID=UPI0021660A6E|nr:DNA-directed RNA polymerase I subunit RPA34 [Lentzea californiensis]